MSNLKKIKIKLKGASNLENQNTIFFKTGLGDYAEHDKFIGVSVPTLRKIAKEYADLSFKDIQVLIKSKINEERLLALIILVKQYQQSEEDICEELYQFYMGNIQYVNNWNLVDSSAHLIVGAHLHKRNKNLLLILAKSQILWERRIAIIATWYFIRKNDLSWTFKISKILVDDKHDLIHKAVGWMLREAGKKDQPKLIDFLEIHAKKMPRTMLRYAIEKLPEEQRALYLTKQTPKAIDVKISNNKGSKICQ